MYACSLICMYCHDAYNYVLGPAYYGCRGFLCDNGTRCIRHSGVCSGYQSCRDGSDEANCCKIHICDEILIHIITCVTVCIN